MAKPKLYLEPRQTQNGKQAINMFYSFNGNRLQYYTGIRVSIKDFRPECNTSDTIKPIKTTASFAASYNSKLESLKLDVVNIVSKARAEQLNINFVRAQLDLIHKPKKEVVEVIEVVKADTFLTYFEKFIVDIATGKRLIATGPSVGNRYKLNSVKNYQTALSSLNRYLLKRKLQTLEFSEIDKSFYEDYRDFIYNTEQKEKSTFSGFIRCIKSVMNESGHEFKSKDFIKPSYESDTIYLTLSEIDKIANLDLSDSTKSVTYFNGTNKIIVNYPTLEKARSLFLVGSYTGQRFGDFSNLELKSIEDNFIYLKQIKTNSRTIIPIMDKLRPVLQKYPEGLPKLSNQKFNEYIKQVAKLAGLDELRAIKTTKGNIEKVELFPLYSLISSHCCRRSYATNMFKAGVPPMLIMSATAHKTETSFLKYIRATNDDKAKLLSETLKKLGL